MNTFKMKSIEFIDERYLIPDLNPKLKYDNIDIIISSNGKESLKHIRSDYNIFVQSDIKNIIN